MSKKVKKPLTEEEQLELDIQLENELARLQRQYRLLDRDRGAGGGAKLAKQKKVLQILQKEESNVLNDLFVATCSTKKTQDDVRTAKLVALLEENDVFDFQIDEKTAHLSEIDTQIIKMKKDVIELRSKQVTDTQLQERVMQGQKTVECLNNKLDTIIKRFCTIIAGNHRLRDQIDHLLIERTSFNKMWERLIKNLNKGKSFMIDLIEQSTIAYDQREEWCSKLQALRVRGHSDLILHTQEMQELQRKLDHDGKLEDFLGVKGQKRVMRDLFIRKMRLKLEKKLKMEQQLEDYRKMLDEIKEFTGIEEIDELAREYIKQEEENFSIFNYINVLYKEIEDFTDKLHYLHKNIDSQKALNDKRALQQEETLVKLQENLDTAVEKVDETQNDLNGTQTQLQKLYVGIDKLFKICKCSNAPFMELLGENTKINDYNVLLYLEVLEQGISELIMNVYYRQKSQTKKDKVQISLIKEDEVARPINLLNHIVPTNPCPLCVEQEQVSDVIDELQFVLDREDVISKLEQRLALPDGLERLHNVSACHLPKSRQIIQRRYQ